VAEVDALNYVFGYTIANDVTARDLQKKDGQWTRAKGFDTFAPVGPWVDTSFDPSQPHAALSGQRCGAPAEHDRADGLFDPAHHRPRVALS
jgi:2-keto-4-pentenoate hydratase/2-oxohepta-3-ene-1,7-dioic acid hydratase in catechol pathway